MTSLNSPMEPQEPNLQKSIETLKSKVRYLPRVERDQTSECPFASVLFTEADLWRRHTETLRDREVGDQRRTRAEIAQTKSDETDAWVRLGLDENYRLKDNQEDERKIRARRAQLLEREREIIASIKEANEVLAWAAEKLKVGAHFIE